MVKEITQAPKSVYWRLIYRIWINNINFKLIFHFTITISKSTLQSDYKDPSNFKNHSVVIVLLNMKDYFYLMFLYIFLR